MTTISILDAIHERMGRLPAMNERSRRIVAHYDKEIDRGCFGLRRARNPQLVLSRIVDRCIGDLRGDNHQPNGSAQR